MRRSLRVTVAGVGGLAIAAAAIPAATPQGARADISKDRAIQVAFAYFRNHSWFTPFPRHEARVACQIPSGGINLPPIPGNCQTRVAVGRRDVLVALTETWSSDDFDGEGGRAVGALSHTWFVLETLKLKPVDLGTFGDFPPQWVR